MTDQGAGPAGTDFPGLAGRLAPAAVREIGRPVHAQPRALDQPLLARPHASAVGADLALPAGPAALAAVFDVLGEVHACPGARHLIDLAGTGAGAASADFRVRTGAVAGPAVFPIAPKVHAAPAANRQAFLARRRARPGVADRARGAGHAAPAAVRRIDARVHAAGFAGQPTGGTAADPVLRRIVGTGIAVARGRRIPGIFAAGGRTARQGQNRQDRGQSETPGSHVLASKKESDPGSKGTGKYCG